MSEEELQRPLSMIGRIKSEKRLAAAAAAATAGATGPGPYLRGVRGEAEDEDRLLKLDWTQVGGCRWSQRRYLIASGSHVITRATSDNNASAAATAACRSCWRNLAFRRF